MILPVCKWRLKDKQCSRLSGPSCLYLFGQGLTHTCTFAHMLVMHIEAVTHIYMDIKENKSTAPWTRSNQSAIMAGLIIMGCFCLFKWRVSVSAILSWIRQWKTVASSSKRWMRAAKSGSTVKYYEGLFRNQCQTFISRVNNVDILSNRFGSTRHERKLRRDVASLGFLHSRKDLKL